MNLIIYQISANKLLSCLTVLKVGNRPRSPFIFVCVSNLAAENNNDTQTRILADED